MQYQHYQEINLIEPLSIKLDKHTNKTKIENKVIKYITSNLEKDKVDETKDYFIRCINEIIKNSHDVLNQGGNMIFERNLKHNNLSIIIKAKFCIKENIFNKLISFIFR